MSSYTKTYITYDIETIGLPLIHLMKPEKNILFVGQTPKNYRKKINEMALSPLTGQIVCLGVKIMQKQENLWVELKMVPLW